MVKPEWGIKRLCQSCGARYYDFLRTPIVCPSCGTTFDSEAVLKSRRARPLPVDDVKPKARKQAEEEDVEEVESEEEEEGLDEEDEALDEDTVDDEDEDEVAEPGKRLPAVEDDDDSEDEEVDLGEDDDDLAPIEDEDEDLELDEEEENR